MNLLRGAKNLESFLKACKILETKKDFSPYKWFGRPHKMQYTELPLHAAFYSKLLCFNPLETDYMVYVNLLKNGLTSEQAVVKLKLSKPPLLG